MTQGPMHGPRPAQVQFMGPEGPRVQFMGPNSLGPNLRAQLAQGLIYVPNNPGSNLSARMAQGPIYEPKMAQGRIYRPQGPWPKTDSRKRSLGWPLRSFMGAIYSGPSSAITFPVKRDSSKGPNRAPDPKTPARCDPPSFGPKYTVPFGNYRVCPHAN